MKTVANRLLDEIDEALSPKKQILEPTPKLTPELVEYAVKETGWKAPADSVATLREHQRRWNVGFERISLLTDHHSLLAWLEQRRSFAQLLADGKPLPAMADWFNREEFRDDYTEQREAIKEGWKLLGAKTVPIVEEMFELFVDAVEHWITEHEAGERGRAATFGVKWGGSTDHVVIKTVRDWAKRIGTTQKGTEGSGASPQMRVQALIKL